MFYSKGHYGQASPTRVRYLPYTHELSLPGWRFKASLPVLEISGPGNVLVDVGNVGGDPGQIVAERGVGDLGLALTWEVPVLSASAPFFDFTIDLKLPTADERRGLGTGRPDVGLQLDAYQTLAGLTVFAGIGYRYRHRSPVFEALNDSVNISLGLSRTLADTVQVGIIYDFRQAASAFSGDTRELLPYVSWSLSPQTSFMFYLVEGFTLDSADTALGIQLTRRW